ncbi:MAG: HEPN domain-containing protein [Clostridiales Family XIII bacterium]|nr:HEPN domain-containing protein [Clostridiales Family XIII bacterium]
MDNEKRQYWLEIADYDFETAKAMLITHRYLYVGFMCHQAIEKAFKSEIAKGGEMPPKVHNLNRLAEEGHLTSALSDEQEALIDILLPLNIEARYPSYKDRLAETLDEETCRNILERTEELLTWIKNRP